MGGLKVMIEFFDIKEGYRKAFTTKVIARISPHNKELLEVHLRNGEKYLASEIAFKEFRAVEWK